MLGRVRQFVDLVANPLKLLQAGNNVCAWGHGEVCVIPCNVKGRCQRA